jgi:hypothetical protein
MDVVFAMPASAGPNDVIAALIQKELSYGANDQGCQIYTETIIMIDNFFAGGWAWACHLSLA